MEKKVEHHFWDTSAQGYEILQGPNTWYKNWYGQVLFSIKLTLFLESWDNVLGSEINNEMSTVGSTSFFFSSIKIFGIKL